MDYQRSCHFHDFPRAEGILRHLECLNDCFSAYEVELDLPDLSGLRSYLGLCKDRASEARRERAAHAEERRRAAADKQQLLEILERQREETATKLSQMQEDYARQQATLERELLASRTQYEENVKRMETEHVSLLRQKEEALSLVEKLNVEEKRRLEAEKKRLSEEYQGKLAAERRSYAASEAQYKAQLSAHKQQQEASEAQLSSTMAALAHQHASESAQLQSLQIPELAFGAEAWKRYFGEVGKEPALPADITTILDADAPFLLDSGPTRQQVKDNHLLVLIPARVNGAPFSLDLLGALIQTPQGDGHSTAYHGYSSSVADQLGAASPASSYWVLMTCDVLAGSRDKSYAKQQALVAGYADYTLPSTLEAATAILLHHVRTGERLYSNDPWTYTRCRDQVELSGKRYPPVVGGISSEGLIVYCRNFVHSPYVGVSVCRKF